MIKAIVAAVALALLLAACGGGASSSSSASSASSKASSSSAAKSSSSSASASSSAATGSASSSASSSSTAAQKSATVAVTKNSKLGKILTDSKGMTLYMFTPDKGGKPVCYGKCAKTWPPLTTQGKPKAAKGVSASGLGTVPRKDGSTQVTYKGHPLYHFASDSKPGDTNGQGLGGKWYVLSPSGQAVKNTGGGGGGY